MSDTQELNPTREAFESFAKKYMNYQIGECFLRQCNDIDSEYTYQNPTTEEAWEEWQRSAQQMRCLPCIN